MDNTYNYQVKISVDNQLSAVLNEVEKQMTKLGKSMGQVESAFARLGGACKKLSRGELGNLVNKLERVATALRSAGGSAGACGQNLTGLSAAAGTAVAGLGELSAAARETGEASGTSVAAATEAFGQFTSQIQINKEALAGLQSLQEETFTFAQAMGTSLAAEAEALGQMALGMGASLVGEAAAIDQLNQAIAGSAAAQEQAAGQTGSVAARMQEVQTAVDGIKLVLFDATGSLGTFMTVVGDISGPLSSFVSLVKDCAAPLVSFFTFMKDCAVAISLFSKQALLAKASVLAKAAADKMAAAATATLSTAQAALNAVMSANPVALVVLAIAGLVAVLAVVYHRCDKFREIVDRVGSGIVRLGKMVWGYLAKAFDALGSAIGKAWDKLKQLLGITGDTGAAEEKTAEAGEKTASVADEMAKAYADATAAVKGFNTSLTTQNGQLGKNLASLDNVQTKLSELQQMKIELPAADASALEKNLLKAPPIPSLTAGGPAAGEGGKVKLFDADDELFDKDAFGKAQQEAQEGLETIQGVAAITGEQIAGGLNNTITGLAKGLGTALATGDWGEQLKSMLVGLMDMLQQFGAALIATATATIAFKSVFANPFVALAAGAALVVAASVAKAALQNATSFADGGIVSGPTLALVGEYAGASRNPEVIAPLDKLRSLIQPVPSSFSGLRLETKVRGKDLYVALRSTEHEMNRTR